LSHAEIEAMLDSGQQPGIDRVTLYRVLDWLAGNGFAHKAADASGVFRYKASTPDVNHAGHIHFRCTGCGGIYCLKAPVPRTPPLPKGFHLTRMNLDLQGECARCSTSHR
jgi:Fur family ferric uptake transcriptional regulator